MVNTEPEKLVVKQRKRKKKYIPGLAAFRFKPNPDWTLQEARDVYDSVELSIDGFKIDQIYFEDCIKGMRRMPDESVDMIIADPPFGIDFNGKESLYRRDGDMVVEGYHEIDIEYEKFTDTWLSELPRIMKEYSTAYVFSGFNNLEAVLASARRVGLETLNHIIWHYQFGVFTRRKFVTSHYHILMLVKDLKKYFFHKIDHYPLDVWTIPRKYKPGEKKNQTALPRRVVQMCIDFSSKPGDTVFDPFMGNGTTASVAKANFRHYIGFEVNENLRDVIEENIESYQLGCEYAPYGSRRPSMEELKRKYPQAYKHLREIGEIEVDESER